MHDASLIRSVLNLTCLGILNSRCHIRRNRACLGVWHKSARTQYLAELPNQAHRIWRCNQHIKVHGAAFDGFRQIFKSNQVCARSFSLGDIVSLSKHSNSYRLAGAMRQSSCATNILIRLTRVDSQINRDINRLFHLGFRKVIQEVYGLFNWIDLVLINFLGNRLHAFCKLRHLNTLHINSSTTGTAGDRSHSRIHICCR